MSDQSPLEQAIAGAAQRFRAELDRAAQVQQDVLQAILQQNQASAFGRRHRFQQIADAVEFATQVPVADYEALAPWITRMAAGEQDVLTTAAVLAFEETGGSTSGRKLIPYTAAGLAAFQQGLLPWLDDLCSHYPGLGAGRFYWAISPACRAAQTTAAGMPIGLPDAAYFGETVGYAVAGSLAVPLEASGMTTMEEWHAFTLRHLFACENLTLISVWSPSFLTELLRHAVLQREQIAAAISDRQRAQLIHDELCRPLPDYRRIWPQLQVISCWDQASAAAGAANLRKQFPHVVVQGKGLLATEGLVTIPLAGMAYPVLSLRSGFFEFIDADKQRFLAHQVQQGREYSLLITTHSGLYRYDIGDRVIVRGFAGQTPMLEFIGRSNATSDLCGEKLSDAFVMPRLAACGQVFAMLAPQAADDGGNSRYVLLLDGAALDVADAHALAVQLDAALHDNPQYAYARKLGQLDAVVPLRCKQPLACWLQERMKQGQRLSDIKIPALLRDEQWKTWVRMANGSEW